MDLSGSDYWALILGGSSGFGLASAKKLSQSGMNVCIVHRDRKGAMSRIEQEFSEIRRSGIKFLSYNLDALSAQGMATALDGLSKAACAGKIRLLLHSIAFGSVKLLTARPQTKIYDCLPALASKLNVALSDARTAVDELFHQGHADLVSLATPAQYEDELLLTEEELLQTIQAMGTSLLSWTQDVFRRGLFAADARVIGLTSEGNETSWLGYAAVSAAKAVLESVARSMAMEYARHGIRSNIVQPGVTDTPALRLIPGSAQLSARAVLRNPFGRLTTPQDVARVIALLTSDEAAWINGSVIRVDGGERIAG